MSDCRRTGLPSRHECDIEVFATLVEQTTNPADYPLSCRIAQGVPVYDVAALANGTTADTSHRAALRDELASALSDGPGIVVLEGAVAPQSTEEVTQVFWRLIDEQRATSGPVGDHFARPGANDRVWNALEKLAVNNPDAFIDYHASDALAVVCEAWLGPRYQLTEQVNVVNPGGEAQQPHRDYHMGFLTDDEAERFPRHAHRLSPLLTLQGAISHCDMSIETGATMYLPHSHKYELGYLAWRRPEFIQYFAQHRVQLPLRVGDAVFFSPAIFHAAGHNRTADTRRIANLLQISSAFGRSTESVDRVRMVNAVYPALRSRLAAGLGRAAAGNVVAACAEGYAFPTNLDLDQPVDGLAPPSQADLMNRALDEDWSSQRLYQELILHEKRHMSTGRGLGAGGDISTGGDRVSGDQISGDQVSAVNLSDLGPADVDVDAGVEDDRFTVHDLLKEARQGAERLSPAELAAALFGDTNRRAGHENHDPAELAAALFGDANSIDSTALGSAAGSVSEGSVAAGSAGSVGMGSAAGLGAAGLAGSADHPGKLHPPHHGSVAAGSAGTDSAASDAGDVPLVIDIRDRDDRERTGMILGSVSIPLLVLQWRCDPDSGLTHPAVQSLDQQLVLVCNQGYTSSLAAASLRRLGFTKATDLRGGVEAWADQGRPMTTNGSGPDQL